MKYGIIGSGSANPKVVQEGLLDIIKSDDNAHFIIHARRAPQGAVSDVYDFLVDNSVPFMAVHRIDDNAPKALLNCAVNAVTNDDPTKTIINNSDVILLLWDEAMEEVSEKLAIMSADAGKPIKDLTMALTPIVIEGSEVILEESAVTISVVEEPTHAKLTTDTNQDIVGFTRDELMNMNIGVLRRQAKALGIENVGKTKQEIVDAIFYNEPTDGDPIIASDISVETKTDYNLTGCLVYYYNNEMKSIPLEPLAVAEILGWA